MKQMIASAMLDKWKGGNLGFLKHSEIECRSDALANRILLMFTACNILPFVVSIVHTEFPYLGAVHSRHGNPWSSTDAVIFPDFVAAIS